jgi:hypothetical protein
MVRHEIITPPSLEQLSQRLVVVLHRSPDRQGTASEQTSPRAALATHRLLALQYASVQQVKSSVQLSAICRQAAGPHCPSKHLSTVAEQHWAGPEQATPSPRQEFWTHWS